MKSILVLDGPVPDHHKALLRALRQDDKPALLITENDMTLKSTLVQALLAMGLQRLAGNAQTNERLFLSDPGSNKDYMPQGHRRYRQRGSVQKVHRLRPPAPFIHIPPGYHFDTGKLVRNARRKPNKLQMVQIIRNDSAAMEGAGVSNYMCSVLAGSWGVPLSHVIEARQRAIGSRAA